MSISLRLQSQHSSWRRAARYTRDRHRHFDNPTFFRQSQQTLQKAKRRIHVSTRTIGSPGSPCQFLWNNRCSSCASIKCMRGKASRQSIAHVASHPAGTAWAVMNSHASLPTGPENASHRMNKLSRLQGVNICGSPPPYGPFRPASQAGRHVDKCGRGASMRVAVHLSKLSSMC